MTKLMTRLYKSYLFTVVARDFKRIAEKDFRKFAKRAFSRIDFDKKYWLHKAGLTTYSPARRTFGGSMLFMCGACCGAMLGLTLAPKKGDELVGQIKEKAKMMFATKGEEPEMARA